MRGARAEQLEPVELPVDGSPLQRRYETEPLFARVRELHDYWLAKRGDRALPTRADIDPLELKSLLPNLIIADVHQNPLRIRFRLAGTAVTEANRCSLTGRWLDELDLCSGLDTWLAIYQRVLDSRAPVFGLSSGTWDGLELFKSAWGIFPLSRDGVTIDQVLEIEDSKGLGATVSIEDPAIDWRIEAVDANVAALDVR